MLLALPRVLVLSLIRIMGALLEGDCETLQGGIALVRIIGDVPSW